MKIEKKHQITNDRQQRRKIRNKKHILNINNMINNKEKNKKYQKKRKKGNERTNKK